MTDGDLPETSDGEQQGDPIPPAPPEPAATPIFRLGGPGTAPQPGAVPPAAAPGPAAAPPSTPPQAAPGGGPSWSAANAPAGTPTASPYAPPTPPVPPAPAAGFGAIPTPGAAPTNPYANPYAAASPGGGPQPFAATPPLPPEVRPRTTRILGIPPSLGLAAALMSFPAVAFVLYGGLAILFSLVWAGSSSNSEIGDAFNDLSTSFAFVGVVLIALGLIGLYGVVMVMAGSSVGRTICTVFLCISLVLVVISFATNPNAGVAVGTLAVDGYCIWALWGRPGRSVF